MNKAQQTLIELTDKRLERMRVIKNINLELCILFTSGHISSKRFTKTLKRLHWLYVNLAGIKFVENNLSIEIFNQIFYKNDNLIDTIYRAYNYAIKHKTKD